jgi:hypothetical protein
MPEQMKPSSKEQSPDPAHSYERSHPQREAGMGRLDNNRSTPTNRPDQIQDTPTNKSDPRRQINAQDISNQQSQEQPDRSMHDEEPADADLSPQRIDNPRAKRHPRTGGKGGTPNEGESTRRG